MRLIERRVRQYFAFQAIVPLVALLISIIRPGLMQPGFSPTRRYGITLSYMILALIYGRAWLVTRRPREFRSPWPVSASLLSVAVGSCSFWFARPSLLYEASGMLTIALGLGGFLLYARAKAPGFSPSPSDSPVISR